MQAIIQPVERSKLITELTPEKFIRDTNNGRNKIYTITINDSPNLMIEIGRLRELTFRAAGGGTGKEIDIDEFDTDNTPYKQLIVWNPEDEQIIGGYRYIKCKDAKKMNDGNYHLATSELFNFSEKFIKDYFPSTIELGRSFVQPFYQPSVNVRSSLYSLDNLWDGLGALVIDNPDIKYFFGKVTMFTSYNSAARDMILYFLQKYFPDSEKLVYPKYPLTINTSFQDLDKIFTGTDYKADYTILSQNVRKKFETIPPLINAYMKLSPTMKTFGTALNPGFGEVEETGIIINIDDIYHIKKERHMSSYIKNTIHTLQHIRFISKKSKQ
jgi:hypothetical protein